MVRKKIKEQVKNTTILSDAPMQGYLLPFMETRQLGRYSTISRQAHSVAIPHLATDKLNRFLLYLYHWFHDSTLPMTLFYQFADPSSIMTCYLTKSDPEKYKAEFRYVDRTDFRSDTIVRQTNLSRTEKNLYIILRTIALVYQHYQGKLHHASPRLILIKKSLAAEDKTHVVAIHDSTAIKTIQQLLHPL